MEMGGEVASNKDKIMLEHILPRNAKDSYWTNNFTTEQRRNYANRLGNLVLITGAKNAKSNNKPFKEKMDSYICKKSEFIITKEVNKLEDWNMDSMKARQQELVEKTIQLFTNI